MCRITVCVLGEQELSVSADLVNVVCAQSTHVQIFQINKYINEIHKKWCLAQKRLASETQQALFG